MSWLCDHRACISLGWIVSADAGCAGSRRIFVEKAFWYEILTPGIISAWCVWYWCFAKYSWCVIILLSIWYNVCACHSPVYHYITASAVYLIQRIITACVVVMWSQSLYLSRTNSQCGHYVCCKSTNTRWKSGLRWNTHGVDKDHVCLVFCIACICELPQDIICLCRLPQWTPCHRSQTIRCPVHVGLTGLVLSSRIVPCIWTTLRLLLLLWYIFLI